MICGRRGCDKEMSQVREYRGGLEWICPCCGYGDGFCKHARTPDGFRWDEIELEARRQLYVDGEKKRLSDARTP